MRRRLAAVLLVGCLVATAAYAEQEYIVDDTGWTLWSFGYYDQHGRFVLAVQFERFDRLVECERARQTVEGQGRAVLARCIPGDDGPMVAAPAGPVTR
jgi:hypothetical protein